MFGNIASMVTAGAGAGAAGGAAGAGLLASMSPFLPVAGIGLAALGGLMSYMGQKKANKANEARQKMIEGLYRQQGENSKNEIGLQAANDRANVEHDTMRRGLTTSTAIDAARNTIREMESRRKAAIDEAVAGNIAGVAERRTDTTSGAGGQALGALARAVSSLQLNSTNPDSAATKAKLDPAGTPDGGAPATTAEVNQRPFSPKLVTPDASLPVAQADPYSNLFRLLRQRNAGMGYAAA